MPAPGRPARPRWSSASDPERHRHRGDDRGAGRPPARRRCVPERGRRTRRWRGATSSRCDGSRTSPSAAPVTHDAVVVGAGPNGLVAANHLADRGWSVLVLEANPRSGGAVRSAEDVHPGSSTTRSARSTRWPPRRRRSSRCGSRSTACAGSTRRPSSGTRCPTAAGRCCTGTARSRPRRLRRAPPRRRRGLAGAVRALGPDRRRRWSARCSTPFPPVRAGLQAARPAARRRRAGLRPRPCSRPPSSSAGPGSAATRRGCCSPATRATRTSRSTRRARA